MTSPQPPQKDFLALTHGQEWVTFYESFDLLVQDHLSRSSDLLRRAMSLPEVADREVAQVRDDLEGKLAAERERTSTVLTDVKTQIVNSHRLASTLAMSIGSLMTDLHSLNMRVDEAIHAVSHAANAAAPAQAIAPAAPTGLLSSAAPAVNAAPTTAGTGYLTGTGSLASWPFAAADATAAAEEVASFEDASTEADTLTSEVVADLADEPVMDVADLAGVADAGDESPIDLTAIAEAEESSSDESPEIEANADEFVAADGMFGESDVDTSSEADNALETDTSLESGERQRPHWLSVTRVGASRP